MDTSLSLSFGGIMMLLMLPVFLINLYHRGPYTGVIGAKVSYKLLTCKLIYIS